MARFSAMILLALLAGSGLVTPAAGANPIRKVVTMLQDMQKTVEEEGEKEEDLFGKFMCYCSNGEGALQASIDAGNAQIEQLGGAIERGTAEKSQLDQDIVTHKADRAAAVKKGLGASLLQTSVGNMLRSVIRTSPLVREG